MSTANYPTPADEFESLEAYRAAWFTALRTLDRNLALDTIRFARRHLWPTMREAAENLIREMERATLDGELSDRACTGRKVAAAPGRRIVAGVTIAELHGGYWYDTTGDRLGRSLRQATIKLRARNLAPQAVA